MNRIVYIAIALCGLLGAQDYENRFTPFWNDRPWNNGGMTPTGAIWSISPVADLTGNGFGNVLLSSAWSGSYGNDVLLYEATDADTLRLIWYAWFNQLDLSDENFSHVATGDLDDDGNPELIVLNDCQAGQDALHIFEFDPQSGLFPALPTASWNLGQSGGVEESGDLRIANLDGDSRPELLTTFYSRSPAATHVMAVELADGSDLANPVWNVEMHDDSTFAYYSYLLYPTDLNGDGRAELWGIEWNYTRLAVWENTAPDQYRRVNDLYLTLEPSAFSNDGMATADLDNNGVQEIYLASTAGYLWIIQPPANLADLSFAGHFRLLADYKLNGGLRLTQVSVGNADTPEGRTGDGGDIYLTAVDSSGTRGVVLDWEYVGGDVSLPGSYAVHTIYEDNDAGGAPFRPSKLAAGNLDGENRRELVLASGGLALDKPHLIAMRASGVGTGLEPVAESAPPRHFRLLLG